MVYLSMYLSTGLNVNSKEYVRISSVRNYSAATN